MSKIKSVVAAALTLCASASAAHAALFTVQFVPNASPAAGLSSYTVNLVSTTSGPVTDYAAAAFTLPSGKVFNQVAAFDDGDAQGSVVQVANSTFTLDYLQYASQEGAFADSSDSRLLNLVQDAPLDTHFNAVYGESPASDDVSGEPATGTEATVLGVGFSFAETSKSLKLNGGVTIGAANRASTYSLAQLVIPTAQLTPIAYTVTDLNGAVVSGSFTPGVPAPEPASLGILALGGVSLLARRKNHISK